MNQSDADLPGLLKRIAACDLCAAVLPRGPRPVVRASTTAKLLIIGQAPGTRVHETGIPWNDRSGERLRDWLGLESDAFYDATQVAIVPAGFCYPGRNPRGGDLPPRPECAETWHEPLLSQLKNIRLTLLVGMYAQRLYLKGRTKKSLTETVYAWQEYAPMHIPLPHPSWRTTAWARRNPWFESDVLPSLRTAVSAVLRG